MQPDVKHRWNFTYIMLKEACGYKNALNQFCQLYLAHQNTFIPEEK